jgi:uncharacterized protein (TIGR02001 family)
MKKAILMTVMMAGVAVAGAARGAEASASLDVASAYVFRGATFNDGLVLQPGLEVAGLPITLGVWGNLDVDDYGGALEKWEFSEIDIYASYDIPVEVIGLSLGYCEYTYPAGGEADREVSLTAGLDTLLAPSVMVAYGFDGAIERTVYVEASLGHDFELSECSSLSLGATVGYVSPDEGEAGFSHYTASASLSYKALSAGVTYIGQIDDDVLPDVEDGGAYDVSVVGTLSAGIEF